MHIQPCANVAEFPTMFSGMYCLRVDQLVAYMYVLAAGRRESPRKPKKSAIGGGKKLIYVGINSLGLPYPAHNGKESTSREV